MSVVVSVVTASTRPARLALALLLSVALVLPAWPGPARAHEGHDHGQRDQARAPQLPAGFQDREVITGLNEPTVVDFAPDGTAFVGTKAGEISTFARAGDGFAGTPAPFADLKVSVYNYWDRGLVGLAVDPRFGTGAGRDYVYVTYTYNRDPRDNPPRVPKYSGVGSPYYDDCATPADYEDGNPVGCIAMARVSRLAAEKVDGAWRLKQNGETQLLADGCFQFPSHASGAVQVGPDGLLYVTMGEGASFDTVDYGQFGNPCGDPAGAGGSLRSQDLRTTGDPLGTDGTLLRIDPMTGLAADGSNDNAKRIAAYGLRNPWRFTFRPGTDEVWMGDVGAGGFDEVNRLTDADNPAAAPRNFGWPCFEGGRTGTSVRTPGWDEVDKPLCESLYDGTAPAAERAVAPHLAYSRSGEVVTGDGCATGTASVSGVQFMSGYPAPYEGALAFADFARGCIWVAPLTNGQPDRTKMQRLVGDAESPVDLTTGPEGDLYYVDYGLGEDGGPVEGAGAIHRIAHEGNGRPPVASFTANPPYSSEVPLSVTFDASRSSDPDADQLTYRWDLDDDGAFDDGDAPVVYRTYTRAGPVRVRVRVDDGNGNTDVAERTVHVGNDPPQLVDVRPGADLRWAVGDEIPFSASATDVQDGPLPASAITWSLAISHCPSVCHSHPIETRTGVPSGVFTAPDHEYPSKLVLRVQATDSLGFTAERSIVLQPKTVDLTFDTTPVDAPVSVLAVSKSGRFTQRVIVGSTLTMSVPETVPAQGRTWRFRRWSDGGERVHQTIAPATDTTYCATYAAGAAACSSLAVRAVPGRLKVKVEVDGKARRSGWSTKVEDGDRVRVQAPKRVRRGGKVWVFKRWSDRGGRAHTVTVRGDLVLKAVYQRRRRA
ncbi:PQQ-dependent sugar dehydrogenase [Nocardioides dongkuii]|uniref:PQQ-dependent sugar dehydrogenase n=1 Tax=Nocardioides dongkuii TaxID=2760089 RepID=UPI0015FC8BCF|nr:PQQ-dependent sugar dehydrogenase [Nocardioides dongkuii]